MLDKIKCERINDEVISMKILVDAMGGDNAPVDVVKGAIEALKKENDLSLVLIGDEAKIQSLLEKEDASLIKRIEIVGSKSVVTNEDHPSLFLKAKADSSMAMCFERLRTDEEIAGMISAGPTGALLTGSILRIGRLPGVHRPALISTLPTRGGNTVSLLDSGANTDTKTEYLVQFALMGNVYLKALGKNNPRVGLLNIGSEEGKGNDLVKETYPLLKELPINFIGNIEPDHIQKDEVDLVVADGFNGNILLKGIEGGAGYVAGLFKGAMKHSIFTKIGALFLLRSIKKYTKPLKDAINDCAPLLGIKKLVIKCHGKGTALTFEQTILKTAYLAKQNLLKNMEESISSALKVEPTK